MIAELYVENFAIIKKADVFFHEGLNIITGESASGKSLLVESILQALGKKPNFESHETSFIKLILYTPKKREIIKEIKNSKSVYYLDSKRVEGRKIKEEFFDFFDYTSGNESLRLISPKFQLYLYDAYLGVLQKRKELKYAYDTQRKLKEEIKRLQEDKELLEKEKDYLEYSLKEVKELLPLLSQEGEIRSQEKKLLNLEKMTHFLNHLKDIFNGDFLGQLALLKLNAQKLKDLDKLFILIFKNLSKIEEISKEIIYNAETIQIPQDLPSLLNQIQEKLYRIEKLKKKYGPDKKEILSSIKKIEERLILLEKIKEKEENLKSLLSKAEEEVFELVNYLSNYRREKKREFEDKVNKSLRELGMGFCDFEISIENKELSEDGKDKLEFLIKTSSNTEKNRIREVASRGEFSRIMLAIRENLQSHDVRVLIFDEIDVGVGGGVSGNLVGEKLKKLSLNFQVICITHLPQIARFANSHILVNKRENEVFVKNIEGEERIYEIARMISDGRIDQKALIQAQNLLII